MGREFVLPVTEEEFTKDERITVPRDSDGYPTAPFGTKYYRPIQVGFVDWKTAGKSFVFPVTVTEGEDEGKTAEIYPGAVGKGSFKTRDTLEAIGVKYDTTEDGQVKFDPDECENKLGTGVWQVVVGHKNGIVTPENVIKQLKFVAIMEPNYKPSQGEVKNLV